MSVSLAGREQGARMPALASATESVLALLSMADLLAEYWAAGEIAYLRCVFRGPHGRGLEIGSFESKLETQWKFCAVNAHAAARQRTVREIFLRVSRPMPGQSR